MDNHLSQHSSCITKQKLVKQLFFSCHSMEQKYAKIIALSKELQPYPESCKQPLYLVKGCQSLMYLYAECNEGKMKFYIYSEALISAGLAALLLSIYNDEPPETILSCPPTFLEELQIQQALSPSRSNGLASLLLRMKQESLRFLTH